jgi:RNA polymerase sigma factor (sigma-70 family)
LKDWELIARLKSGDPKTLGFFWREFFAKTYPICSRILGKGPDATDTAVDLLTDFLEIRIHDLKDPSAIFAYLRLAAIRRSVEVKKRRDIHASLDFDIEAHADRTPETEADVTELMPRLDRCLRLLTEKAGQCLRLKYTNEMTNEDIGHLLGGSKQYIGRLIQKSLEALRACIEKGFGNAAHAVEETMTREIQPHVTLKIVEHLLSLRQRPDQSSHAAELLTLAEAISGSADNRAKEQADEHLAHCSDCRDLSMRLHRLDFNETFDNKRLDRMPFSGKGIFHRPSSQGALFSVAAVLVLGLSIVFFANRNPTSQEEAGRLTVKGFEDDFVVAARRDRSTFTVNPLDRLKEGDALGMFYSSVRPGFLMVLNVDSDGNAEVLYPASYGESRAVSQGERISIADGALVESGHGCEWLVAVFSNMPIARNTVIDAVKKGRLTKEGCGLDITVDGARTIRILPVTR